LEINNLSVQLGDIFMFKNPVEFSLTLLEFNNLSVMTTSPLNTTY
jgi:hypothetical protein